MFGDECSSNDDRVTGFIQLQPPTVNLGTYVVHDLTPVITVVRWCDWVLGTRNKGEKRS